MFLRQWLKISRGHQQLIKLRKIHAIKWSRKAVLREPLPQTVSKGVTTQTRDLKDTETTVQSIITTSSSLLPINNRFTRISMDMARHMISNKLICIGKIKELLSTIKPLRLLIWSESQIIHLLRGQMPPVRIITWQQLMQVVNNKTNIRHPSNSLWSFNSNNTIKRFTISCQTTEWIVLRSIRAVDISLLTHIKLKGYWLRIWSLQLISRICNLRLSLSPLRWTLWIRAS